MEVILGAEDFDADLAGRYGWINRALLDSQQSRNLLMDLGERAAGFKFLVARPVWR